MQVSVSVFILMMPARGPQTVNLPSKPASKQARKQASQPASKQAGRQAGKQASKQASKRHFLEKHGTIPVPNAPERRREPLTLIDPSTSPAGKAAMGG